ncbi:diguanylate cyclase domain-containing protein [Dactylosporangium siamense]|nr:sensor domain-containing diguanylate cyclase [Dactylosporangium siamense]
MLAWLLVVVVLLVGTAASTVAVVAVQRAEQRYAAQLMDRYGDDAARLVTAQVAVFANTVTDLAAAIGAQSDLSALDFAAIVSGLNRQRLPGTSGIAYVVPASDVQAGAVQAAWRQAGVAGLTLTPSPAGAATERLYVVLDRPFDGAASVAGRDLSGVAPLVQALRIARDDAAFTISSAYVLTKDRALPAAQQQTSFTVSMPVHGRAGTADTGRFRGWLVMGVRGGDFINQTLHLQAHGAVHIQLTDASTTPAKVIAAVTAGTRVPDDRLHREHRLTLGQRDWELTLAPTTRLLSVTDRRLALMTGAGGAILTLLLTTLVGVLAGARNRAMTQVDSATAALRLDIRRRQETEQRLREREDELRQLAFHDPLTGLVNRILLHERVEHAMATHARAGHSFAVLFVDLDGFKPVNDTFGHAAGDQLLCQVAQRLTRCVRSSDTVARYGGDEFAILAEHLASPDDALITADRIIAALIPPHDLNGTPVTVSASIGVALGGDHAGTDDILRAADDAMYQAKAAGKGRTALASNPTAGP